VDLMHYGCPYWLPREFANPQYPQAVAAYAAAFARRYAGLVRWYTPLNEPLVNALMCGKRGLWPPYLRGETGYIRIMLQLAKGILESVKVLKEVDPQSVLVHVEAVGLSRAAREDLEALAADDARRGYLSYDLLTGRVSPGHPLFLWLVRNGASPDDLAQLAARRIDLDVIGMNFYPQWSTKEVFITPKGKVAYRNIEGATSFGKLIEDYYERYKVPIIVTETSAFGPDAVRKAWLEASIRTIKELRSRSVPVLGYTWFPMMTMIDWRYRFGRGAVEKYRIELGLYRLAGDGAARWNSTPLVAQFRGYVDDPERSIGSLVQEPQLAGGDRGEIASG
jgi:beta-glucosidase